MEKGFVSNLTTLMDELGVSGEALARTSGVSAQTVRKMKKANKPVSRYTAAKVIRGVNFLRKEAGWDALDFAEVFTDSPH